MKQLRYLLALMLLAMSSCPWADAAGVILANVRVVDVRAGDLSGLVDVEILGSRIAAVRPAGSDRAPGVEVFEGRGRYVVPGFWDMHAHLNASFYPEQSLPLFITAGVTGVRDMWGDCMASGCADTIQFMRALQARLASGALLGPRILAVASDVVHGPREGAAPGAPAWTAPATAADARTLVQEFKAHGVDFIKPYDTLPREAYFELLQAASAVGLRLSGHVPMSVSTLEAVQAGQLTIEHAKHPAIDCGTYSDEFHRTFARWAAGDSPRIYRGWVNAARGDQDAGSYYQKVLATYDEARCNRIIAGIAATRAWYVPTLITRRFEALADEAAFLDDPRLALVPPVLRAQWRADAQRYKKRFADAPDEKRAYVELYELAVKLTGRMHAAGVPVLVGTDSPDSYCFAGSGYHDELRELHKAGLSNAAILRAATLSAAQFLGREAEFGTVEAGKSADLVILTADPLADISNTRRIEAVVLNGRLLKRADLSAIEAGAARAVAVMK